MTSKNQTICITCETVEDTQQAAAVVGWAIDTGIVLLLYGDLGSGKTAFVQGLAKGLGVPDKCYVSSPTYTLVNEYPGRLVLSHVDLYRLDGPDDFDDIGLYDLLANPQHVVAIEWAQRLHDDLPHNIISIHIRNLDVNSRSITLYSPSAENRGLMQRIRKKLCSLEKG